MNASGPAGSVGVWAAAGAATAVNASELSRAARRVLIEAPTHRNREACGECQWRPYPKEDTAATASELCGVAVLARLEPAVAREPADAVQLLEQLDLAHQRRLPRGSRRIGARPADRARLMNDPAVRVGDVGVAVPAQDVDPAVVVHRVDRLAVRRPFRRRRRAAGCDEVTDLVDLARGRH